MNAPAGALSSAAVPLSVLEPDARVQDIPEAVIQDIWASQEFDADGIQTSTGACVTVLQAGSRNTDSGPDFSKAHVRIESVDAPSGMLDWSGDVEIHRTSSEWLLHRHHEDPNYNRVVLHVVLLDDRHTGMLRRSDGTLLPEVVLYPRLTSSLRSLLHNFYSQTTTDFYCEAHWQRVPSLVRDEWVQRLGLQRLHAKAQRWVAETPTADLDELIYRGVLRALGYSKNADAMSELARRVPLALVRSQNHARDMEALLFGVSGLLPQLPEMLHADRHSVEYVVDLRDRFERIAMSQELRPMSSVAWQYFRLRPANFPPRRIAQAIALLAPMTGESAGGVLHSDTVESFREALAGDKPKRTLRLLFQKADVSDFWKEHVRFEHRSPAGSARIGKDRADRILMDVVLPTLLFDAEQRRDRTQEEHVGAVLRELPAGSDEVTRMFESHGPIPTGALGTQGLHQLHRVWCSEGHCLSCEIGRHLLRSKRPTI